MLHHKIEKKKHTHTHIYTQLCSSEFFCGQILTFRQKEIGNYSIEQKIEICFSSVNLTILSSFLPNFQISHVIEKKKLCL